jgi:hypothetical protein
MKSQGNGRRMATAGKALWKNKKIAEERISCHPVTEAPRFMLGVHGKTGHIGRDKIFEFEASADS